MALNTERVHDQAMGLDARPVAEIAQVLIDSQIAAAQAVHPTAKALCDAAQAMARTIRSGGVLTYVGAGSSGLMAAADAMELGGTFGIPADQVRIVMAGGLPTSSAMPGATEDETAGLDTALARLTPDDTVIAVAASGATPFTLSAARIARACGASVIGLANNPGAPLLEAATLPVLLETPPEVLSGSTRLGAGTAQKIALNTLSTLMAVALGHVHDGRMINLIADNDKLRARALGIVKAIARRDDAQAARALDATQGDVKAAILVCAGAETPARARALLKDHDGRLRAALSCLNVPK